MSKPHTTPTPDSESRAKRITSKTYRAKVKTFVETIKTLRGLHKLPRVSASPTMPDRVTVHAALEQLSFEETRRMRSPNERAFDKAKDNAAAKDSLRY